MKRLMPLVCAAMFLALLPSCSRKEAPPKAAAPAGVAAETKPAPDITVRDLAGTQLRLSSLKGKVVLLNFWATWCPPCREEIPSMIRLTTKMAGKPFQMVAVSIDEGGAVDVTAFLQKSGQGALPAYLDIEGQGTRKYGITGVPETFIIDRSGILVKKVIGPMAWDSPEAVAFLEGLMK